MSENVIKCCVCQKQFSATYNLAKHARKYHAEQVNLIIPKKIYKYPCTQCDKKFSHLKNFNFHKKIHTTQNLSSDPSFSLKNSNAECPICKQAAPKENLIIHFEVEHDIKCLTQTFEFTSFKEFAAWKTDMEHNSKSKYVVERGSQCNKDGTRIMKYCCHRSGKYIPSGKGSRHLKTQGSNKINGFCPARLKVTIDKNNHCKLSFVAQHVGHDENDLGHLFLTSAERKSLANKVALKIPFSQILDDIRDSIVGSQLERVHLLSRKDLSNIERSFHLQSDVVRHANDAVSVDAWVKQRERSGSVLFYKPQDIELENHPALRKEDFVLVIMNPGQEEVFRKFCSDCICVDGTHGLNQYDFEMHTLLIIDDVREGFPCAFLISNRSDEVVMKIFFQYLKEKIGFQVNCNVFMSDMAEAYYNAWKYVMGPAQHRLFCTWHVDRSWRKNLSKIKTKEKQVMVYKFLRTLLQERDENAFLIMLDDFIGTVTNDQETFEFSQYFKNNYTNNLQCWAYCHRLHTGLNTNMHIERMHKTIKYIYFGGRKVKRLDKALYEIEKFIRDRLINRLVVLFKGKLSHKLNELRARHDRSQKLSTELLVPNGAGWEIPSSNSFEVYVLEEREEGLACENCKLVCTECDACIHKFTCTCIDSCIKFNMCKHIHLLCRYLKHQKSNPISETATPDEDNLVISEDPNASEVFGIVTSLSVNKFEHTGDVAKEKEKLIYNFTQLMKSVTSMEQVDAVKKVCISLEPTLEAIAVKKQLGVLHSSVRSSSPSNKKIDTQRGKLRSTKRKTSKALTLVTPTNDEMQAIAMKSFFK